MRRKSTQKVLENVFLAFFETFSCRKKIMTKFDFLVFWVLKG